MATPLLGQVPSSQIEVNQRTYQVTFTVTEHLVADVILGFDVLRQYHSVTLELGGEGPKTVICGGINELVFPINERKSPLRPYSPIQSKVQNQSLQKCAATNSKTSLPSKPRLPACSLRAKFEFQRSWACTSLCRLGRTQATDGDRLFADNKSPYGFPSQICKTC